MHVEQIEHKNTSGGSRGGSMGSMEPLFWRAAFENTMRKRTMYTTLTLELRTSASRIAITHVCRLLYQEFDARMAYVHVYTMRSTWQPSRQWVKRVSKLNLIHALLPLQLGMAICYQFESAYFPAPRITSYFPASAARSGVTPLILRASNTTMRFSSRSSNFRNFTPRIHQKRSQKVRNPKFSWGGMPQTPLAGTLYALYWLTLRILEPPFSKF